MPGQITIATTVSTALTIKSNAEQTLARFNNGFDSTLSAFTAFDEGLDGLGLDQATLDEIAAIKSGFLTTAIDSLETRLAELNTLAGN